MSKVIKNFAKSILTRNHLKLIRTVPDCIAGIDLLDDLPKLIPQHAPLCFDIGANKGQTIRALRRVLKSPVVYSFEPSSELFSQLNDAHAATPGVTLVHAAVGAKQETREFVNYVDSCLSSLLSLEENPEFRLRNLREKKREIVEVVTIDEFVQKHRIDRIDLLKTDTQGFDLEVLKGAERSLQNGIVKHILVELNFSGMYQGQASVEDILAFLKQRAFRLVDFYEKNYQDNVLTWCNGLFRSL